jgi:hypothetical protein
MSTDSAGTTAVVRTELELEGIRSPAGGPSHPEEQTVSIGR